MVVSQVPWLECAERLGSAIEKLGYTKLAATSIGLYAAYKVIYALYLSPLRSVPGPFIARITKKRSEIFGATGGRARIALEDYERYGDIYVTRPNAISICNPADIRAVLGTHSFRKNDLYKALDFFEVQTSASARDPKLASLRRRQIGPYFSNSYLARMEDAILEHGIVAIKGRWDSLLKQSSNGEIVVNYHKTFLYATFDTIGSLAFGREFGALESDDPTIGTWLRGTLSYFGLRTFLPLFKYYPFSFLISPLFRLCQGLIDHGARCIAERKKLLADLERTGELDKKPADLLQGFIEIENAESRMRMTPREVHAEAIIALIAGSETSSNSLMWTIHLFLLYPECYKRAVDEVRSAFDKDHLIAYSEAKVQLPYLEACIHESMRLIPAAGGQLPRLVPSEGVTLGGHFIPGGTEINVNILGANYNKKYWKDPHRFDPTRFLDNEEAKKNVFTFSYGVRVCPGKQLAWIEMFTILANMLKDYDIRLPDDITHFGPSTLTDKGYPKLMDAKNLLTTCPTNADRDCRIVISERI
ncbi:hypothetical protein GGI12_003173 [Dipsacomyces acuminosporus]|nr:hypothetical protein GGI12_003173 [Dipsacomyces acuminosporus]